MGGRLAYLKERSRSVRREGRKTKVFPLAEGPLASEVAAAPLSRHAKGALLEEDPNEEPGPVRPGKKTLPPTEKNATPDQKKAQPQQERKREKRRKEERMAKSRRVGHLAAFGGSTADRA